MADERILELRAIRSDMAMIQGIEGMAPEEDLAKAIIALAGAIRTLAYHLVEQLEKRRD